MAREKTHSLTLLGHTITPHTVREIRQKAANADWGAHLLRWRYFDVQHERVTYHRNALIPSGLWHLLKRVYVDQDWPADTSQEDLAADITATIQNARTEIYVYGLLSHRPAPPAVGLPQPTDQYGCRLRHGSRSHRNYLQARGGRLVL